ncbi:UNVERIFIED_CONTAM: hypothetical protein GTU68_066824 [Idotea baltica]|nr:hypothetical protein [Idotea baltica]
MNQAKSYRSSFILLTVLFFLWGFITVLVDSLIPRLRELFTLSYFQAGMVQFAFFGAYFLLSIPASFILSKIGYKRGIILGLLTMAFGCLLFYPAASYRQFSVFMLAYFILAGGMTVLQVAANPFVAALGSEDGASSRLNLSQAFNSVGTAIAPIIGALYILSTAKESYLAAEAAAVQKPFVGLAIFIGLIAVVFFFAKLPKLISEESTGTYIQAFKKKNLMLGVLGIFFYVGAEVAIGSYLINYFLDMNLVPIVRDSSGIFVLFYWTGAMIGRFVGSYLTTVMKPGKVLGIFATLAVTLIIISMSTTGLVSMWTIIAVGLFNSIMFPTIFTLAIDGLGELKPKASGLLCTAIVGGAIIPPLFGLLVDYVGFKTALIFVICCYAYILYYGLKNTKSKHKAVTEYSL